MKRINQTVDFFFQVMAIITISILCLANVHAQGLESGNYHQHRSSLMNSYLKFQNEKKGRVVFLGGSITYNPGWRDSLCQYLYLKFPDTEFDFINAGIPSMGSTPGAFRFERDVLKNGPVDLLIIESAVNDDTNRRTPEEIIRAMEGIARHAMTANPDCDMVIMYFVDPGKMDDYRNGKIPDVIQLHEKVADHYHISSINLAKEVTDRIDAGEFSWETDFKNLHPSPFGQQVYFHSMKQFLEDGRNQGGNNQKIITKNTSEPLDAFSYTNGMLVEPDPSSTIRGWQFVENWHPDDDVGTRANYDNVPMMVGTYPGKKIRFRFEGNAVGIAVAAGPDAGTIEYRIDHGAWQTQDLYTNWSSQLYLPWFYTLASGLESEKHTLHIRLVEEKHSESIGNTCILRYFYYNANNPSPKWLKATD